MKPRQLLLVAPLLLSFCAFVGCGGGGASSSSGAVGGNTSGGGSGSGGSSTSPLTIVAVSPSHMQVTQEARRITVYGSNFSSSSSILFDGLAVTADQQDSGSIGFIPPQAIFKTAGIHTLQVSDPINGKSNTMNFTVYVPARGPLVFATASSEPILSSPSAVADMNGDGRSDLVGITQAYDGKGSYQVSIDYGQTSGVLGDPVATNILIDLQQAEQLIPGDFNKDGRVDVVVIYRTKYEVYLAGGDNKFTLAGSGSLSGQNWGRGVFGDFNGDGKLDFAVDTGSMPPLQVLFGNGDGTFASPKLAGTSPNIAAEVVAADLNNDGRTDITFFTNGAYSAVGAAMHTLLFQSDGTFTENILTNAICPCTAFALGDFNSDGMQDIFLVNNDGAGQAFFGKGDGVIFNAVPKGVAVTDGFLANPPMAVGDFDHDGHLDIATRTTISGPDFIKILWGDGYGGFSGQLITSDQTAKLDVGDINGDGLTDLFEWGLFGPPSVIVGQTNRNFPTAKPFLSPTYGWVSAGYVESGRKEVLVSGVGNCTTSIPDTDNAPGVIYEMQPNTAPALKSEVPGCPAVLADLDGDGIAEMIGWDRDGKRIVVFKGDGSGAYTAMASQTSISGDQTMPDVVVRDMDKDGRLDIVLAGWILYGKPGLQFDAVQMPGTVDQHYAVGDFDGDGIADITYSGRIQFGAGGRQYASLSGEAPTCWSSYSDRVAVADINRDGKDDIVCNGHGAEYDVYLSLGRRGLVLDQPLPLYSTFPGGVVVGDFNNDGLPDVAAGLLGPDDVVLFTNNGAGAFNTSQFVVGLNPMQIVASDFNGDGGLDLAFINYGYAYKPPTAAFLLHK